MKRLILFIAVSLFCTSAQSQTTNSNLLLDNVFVIYSVPNTNFNCISFTATPMGWDLDCHALISVKTFTPSGQPIDTITLKMSPANIRSWSTNDTPRDRKRWLKRWIIGRLDRLTEDTNTIDLIEIPTPPPPP